MKRALEHAHTHTHTNRNDTLIISHLPFMNIAAAAAAPPTPPSVVEYRLCRAAAFQNITVITSSSFIFAFCLSPANSPTVHIHSARVLRCCAWCDAAGCCWLLRLSGKIEMALFYVTYECAVYLSLVCV